MDDVVKIYVPTKKNGLVSSIKWWFDPMNNLGEEEKKPVRRKRKESTALKVLKQYRDQERKLTRKHPWVPILFNWIVLCLVVAIIIASIVNAINISTEKKVATRTAVALADYQAEQEAAEAEEARLLAEERMLVENVMKDNATELAKIFYGISKFQDKYHYTKSDFKTLARCVFNRVENQAYSNDIYEVISQPEQWVGYNSNNPVLSEYYNWAYEFVKEWYDESAKPVSNDYLWAELTPNGIWLKNDFKADGYARRWRAD